jgi:hypothetical protein
MEKKHPPDWRDTSGLDRERYLPSGGGEMAGDEELPKNVPPRMPDRSRPPKRRK